MRTMPAIGSYRVNFGNCQVTHTMRTRREADAYLTAARRDTSDPWAHVYYVERYDGDGMWVKVRPAKKAGA